MQEGHSGGGGNCDCSSGAWWDKLEGKDGPRLETRDTYLPRGGGWGRVGERGTRRGAQWPVGEKELRERNRGWERRGESPRGPSTRPGKLAPQASHPHSLPSPQGPRAALGEEGRVGGVCSSLDAFYLELLQCQVWAQTLR